MAVSPRRLVWSEVRDLLAIAACDTVEQLQEALRAYADDPPMPDEPIDDDADDPDALP